MVFGQPSRRRLVVWLAAGVLCLGLVVVYDQVGPRRLVHVNPDVLRPGSGAGTTGLTGPVADTDRNLPSADSGLYQTGTNRDGQERPAGSTEPSEERRWSADVPRQVPKEGSSEHQPGAGSSPTGAGSPAAGVAEQLIHSVSHITGWKVFGGQGSEGGRPQPSRAVEKPAAQRQTPPAQPLTGRGGDSGESGPKEEREQESARFTPPHQVLVHLDLKGAPPSVPFLKDVIALSAGLGATGLLIEWEDKFPFWGELKPVATGNAYTMSQVREIVDTARAHNLSVMPLVQTFGHVEFVLKLPQFAHLREDPSTPQALCPSRNASARLVETLLDQVMTAHTGADRVHIGSDEVFVLGRCDLCRRRRKDDLLLGHIARTARYVRDRYNATAVLWEDMLRNSATDLLRRYGLDRGLVEPMLWWYTPNVRKYVAPQVWRHAERVYPHVWGAGSYKGAFGSALFAPPIDRHVQNNLDWTELLAEEDGRLAGGVRGLVLTGWSRYDHFATLPELLAAAVPCLAFSLAAVRRGALDAEAAETAQRALGCPTTVPLRRLHWPYLYDEMRWCRFPGQRVYLMMQRYNGTAVAVRNFLDKFETGQESSWLGRYNARHNFTSVLKIRETLPLVRRNRLMVAGLLAPLYRELSAIYDRDLVLEWLEHRVLPLLEDLDNIKERLESMKERRDFPARPLKGYPEHFVQYMDEFVRGWRESR